MKKKILIAPLNWGLGHATRCIPIINALIIEGFDPIIASDGSALKLLQKEFPKLSTVELPSYDITYSKKAKHFRLKLLKDFPRFLKTLKKEIRVTQQIIDKYSIDGIISDNRLGVYNKKVPSVYITHQLTVLSGITTCISTKIHKSFIKKFDICWIPDAESEPNLSGKLGHSKTCNFKTEYIGPLSRFRKTRCDILNDILILLSGPEPQRTTLEEKLLLEFKNYHGKVVFVRGIMEEKQTVQKMHNMTLYNFMTSSLLEKTINESGLIISRSGYTTIMDLAKLNKKAFFIPTPGQFEQEYLAKRLSNMKCVPSSSQDDFTLNKLYEVEQFKGLEITNQECDFAKLFSLFQSE